MTLAWTDRSCQGMYACTRLPRPCNSSFLIMETAVPQSFILCIVLFFNSWHNAFKWPAITRTGSKIVAETSKSLYQVPGIPVSLVCLMWFHDDGCTYSSAQAFFLPWSGSSVLISIDLWYCLHIRPPHPPPNLYEALRLLILIQAFLPWIGRSGSSVLVLTSGMYVVCLSWLNSPRYLLPRSGSNIVWLPPRPPTDARAPFALVERMPPYYSTKAAYNSWVGGAVPHHE